MKTIMIYDEGCQAIEFFVLDGDYSHLNRVYINDWACNENLQDELSSMLYDSETGERILEGSELFPVHLVEKDTIVIVTGFVP